MGKRDEFWRSLPEVEGQVRWPEDAEARSALVRGAFGATVIGALEAVLSDELEAVDGKPPAEGQNDYQAALARRQVFASMSEPQRAEVRRTITSATFGALYWILVKLENFPAGNIDFTVEPFTPDEETYPRVGIEETELHQLYFDWLERFSERGPQ
jgi:hypothetical protein